MLDSYISTRIQPGCRRISGITSFRHFSLNSSSFGTLSSSVLAFDLAAFHSGMLKKKRPVEQTRHGIVSGNNDAAARGIAAAVQRRNCQELRGGGV